MTALFEKVFVPNRGVVAVRALRALHELGIRSVLGFSDHDRFSLAARLADETHRLGPAPCSMSYLDPDRVIRSARRAGCDAVFPGYGFLSESADFADLCAESGITFIGPPPSILRQLGQKDAARRTLSEAGFTVLPGTDLIRAPMDVRAFGEIVGYPLMLKPVAGAGGLGTVRVDDPSQIREALRHARTVAQIALGDDAVIAEQRIDAAAAISVQFLVDGQGHAVHLGEREGSVQRRFGKIVDEAPSPKVDAATRQRMGSTVASAMAALGYVGAGAVEFLVDRNGEWFAIEVNPRLQADHAVTEMVTGVDLVDQMIRIAAGEPMTLRQEDVSLTGHAVLCRILAEDPRLGFAPSPGLIRTLHLPDGPALRHDEGLCQGAEVPLYYDSLLLELAAAGEDRPEAVARLASGLAELRLVGIETTVELQRRILEHPAFVDGSYDPSFLAAALDDLLAGRTGTWSGRTVAGLPVAAWG